MKTGQYGRTGSARGLKTASPKPSRADWSTPEPQGLFDPRDEKDSCGVGFIADIKGRKSHQIVEDALAILLNLEHRGAVGAARVSRAWTGYGFHEDGLKSGLAVAEALRALGRQAARLAA